MLSVASSKLCDEHGRLAALERYAVLDTPPEGPFDKITSLVRNVLGVPISAVSLIDRDRQWFKSIQGLDVTETPRSASFCSHTIQLVEPLLVSNTLTDPRFNSNPLVTGDPNIRSYAGVPLQTPDGYNVGALCAIDYVPRDFSNAQIDILTSFASLIVDELELRRIAERDYLTHALTRRGFVEATAKEITRFQRYGRASVLLMFDIDHFKQINDQFGHPAGDEVLKTISAACQGHLRSNDLFGRLGGEEFAILLVETDSNTAFAAAEKIRRLISKLVFEIGAGIEVTASFGVALISSGTLTPEQWISQADEALYVAKRSGRNRSVLHNSVHSVEAA